MAAGRAEAAFIFEETFADDPVANGRATVSDPSRFSFAPGVLTSAYDSGQTTATIDWALGTTFNQSTDFSFSVRYRLPSALTEGGGQISFGLVNRTGPVDQRTGGNRDGGPDFIGASGSAYNIVTVDYFPGTAFGNRSLGPTVIQSNTGTPTDFYSRFAGFAFGDETTLGQGGEVLGLPSGTVLRADLDYDAATRELTLRVFDETANAFLNLNAQGALSAPINDGDATTIRGLLPGADFSVDTFSIPLWRIFDTPTVGNIEYLGFTVSSPVPEPSTWVLLSVAVVGLALAARRSRRATA